MSSLVLRLLPAALVLLSPLAKAADWPRFRGPDGSGSSGETGLPEKWSESEGLAFKLELPGAGSSSPIVSGGRVYLTCYSGYGVEGVRGEPEKLRLHLVSVDARSGKLIWDRSIEPKLPEAALQGPGMPQHGYASHTPVADGSRVYAFFGKSGVVAFDLEGKEAWRAAVAPEPRTHMFGSGASPVVYKDLLIVPAGIECEAIVAFNQKDGKEAWRTSAQGYGGFWGTPVLADAGDRKELLLNVPGEVWALNPENGKLRWHSESFQEQIICPSIVVGSGVAYAMGGRRSGAVAVKLGGKGDVTKDNVVWKKDMGAYVPSPVFHEGHLYWVNDRGVANCVNAGTGDIVFEERLGDSVAAYASLVVADGKLYAVTRRSGTYVLDAKPKYRQIAVNKIASDASDFNGSPAVSGGRLYLRSNRFLYCVGSPGA